MSTPTAPAGNQLIDHLIAERGFLETKCCGVSQGCVNPTEPAGSRLEQTCNVCGGGFVIVDVDGVKSVAAVKAIGASS